MTDPDQQISHWPSAVRLDRHRANVEADHGDALPREVETTRRYVDTDFVLLVLDSNEGIDEATVAEIMAALS